MAVGIGTSWGLISPSSYSLVVPQDLKHELEPGGRGSACLGQSCSHGRTQWQHELKKEGLQPQCMPLCTAETGVLGGPHLPSGPAGLRGDCQLGKDLAVSY